MRERFTAVGFVLIASLFGSGFAANDEQPAAMKLTIEIPSDPHGVCHDNEALATSGSAEAPRYWCAVLERIRPVGP